jgi:hypothetical protein
MINLFPSKIFIEIKLDKMDGTKHTITWDVDDPGRSVIEAQIIRMVDALYGPVKLEDEYVDTNREVLVTVQTRKGYQTVIPADDVLEFTKTYDPKDYWVLLGDCSKDYMWTGNSWLFIGGSK